MILTDEEKELMDELQEPDWDVSRGDFIRWGYYDKHDGFGYGRDKKGKYAFIRENGQDAKQYIDEEGMTHWTYIAKYNDQKITTQYTDFNELMEDLEARDHHLDELQEMTTIERHDGKGNMLYRITKGTKQPIYDAVQNADNEVGAG